MKIYSNGYFLKDKKRYNLKIINLIFRDVNSKFVPVAMDIKYKTEKKLIEK